MQTLVAHKTGFVQWDDYMLPVVTVGPLQSRVANGETENVKSRMRSRGPLDGHNLLLPYPWQGLVDKDSIEKCYNLPRCPAVASGTFARLWCTIAEELDLGSWLSLGGRCWDGDRAPCHLLAGCCHLGEEGSRKLQGQLWQSRDTQDIVLWTRSLWHSGREPQALHLPTWSRLPAVRMKLLVTDLSLVLWMEILTLLDDLILRKSVDLREGLFLFVLKSRQNENWSEIKRQGTEKENKPHS